VRHTHLNLRSGSNVADIQVNFTAKGDRKAQSHDIAKRLRPPLKMDRRCLWCPHKGGRGTARSAGAEYPGGGDLRTGYGHQVDIARQVRGIFEKNRGRGDVDWFVEDDQRKVHLEVDQEKRPGTASARWPLPEASG
jgi:hypothetical protein